MADIKEKIGKSENTEFNTALGRRVKEKRLELKWSREKLAERSRLSDKFIYDIEVGNKGMTAWTMSKVAKALGVSGDWLMWGDY